MTNDLRPYPEYKESGLPWLGPVPAHWDVRRNGRLFAQRNETGYGSLPILEVSLKTGVRVRDMDDLKRKQMMSDRDKYKRAVKGDIAYNMMRMWQGAVGVAPVDGLVSPAYVVARSRLDVEPRYFSYLFRTNVYMHEVDAYSRGIVKDRNRLYWEDFKRMRSCVPPLEEQKAIADYLDANAIKVRRFIRNRRRLIEVLNEQEQAIINRAVTRGLELNVHLKPSGIDWLGDVPEHWEVKRLKWVTRLQRGYDLPQQDRIQGQYPVVSSGGVIDTHCECRARGPGVVMGRYGSTDAVFYVERDFWPHNTSLFVNDFQGNDRRWCYYLLRTISKADHAGKSAVPGVDRKDLFDIRVVQPRRAEQEAIARHLDEQSKAFDSVTDRIKREIDSIREYRERLIADVVTGKLDVRNLAPQIRDTSLEEGEPFEEECTNDEVASEDAGDLIEEGTDADA